MAVPQRKPNAPKQTKRQVADEAYARMLEKLPGQLTLDGHVVGDDGAERPTAPAPDAEPVHEGFGLSHCPDCKRVQTADAGWTALTVSVRHPALQCGGCGAIIGVTPEQYDAVRTATQLRFANRIARPKPTASKRERGAR